MSNTFLICSVGGTPAPLVASLRHWKPQKVCFIVSNETRLTADVVITEYSKLSGVTLSPGCVDFSTVANPEVLTSVIETIRPVTRIIHDWMSRGDQYKVVTDFTGGTKCMTAGLALVARRWPCEFSYVGGSQRSKSGVGIVESGSELVKSWGNPWDLLRYQAVEDAVTVFNQGGYAAAGSLIESSMKSVENPTVKRTLLPLCALIKAFAAWDRFDHDTAINQFSEALKFQNDLSVSFANADDLIKAIHCHKDFCVKLNEGDGPTWLWVDDLMNNAMRRAQEQRFDDAVARMYRACEAIAQVRLREKFQIENTGQVPVEKLPPCLQKKWKQRTDNGSVRIALQDAYKLLLALEDDLGLLFVRLGLADLQRSPLTARNSSILAHGFQPVSKSCYDQLEQKVCQLRKDNFVQSNPWRLPEVR